MKLFTMYRRAVPELTHDENQRNAPDEPQFQGVVFDDGRVSVRWLTAKRSVSVWDNMEDMLAIHGHPEYGSELVWHEGIYTKADMEAACELAVAAVRSATGALPKGYHFETDRSGTLPKEKIVMDNPPDTTGAAK